MPIFFLFIYLFHWRFTPYATNISNTSTCTAKSSILVEENWVVPWESPMSWCQSMVTCSWVMALCHGGALQCLWQFWLFLELAMILFGCYLRSDNVDLFSLVSFVSLCFILWSSWCRLICLSWQTSPMVYYYMYMLIFSTGPFVFYLFFYFLINTVLNNFD